LRHPAPIPTGATGSVGTATGFSLGIPYTVTAHNAVNNTAIWCAPLPGGACTTSANSTNRNIYATMPPACTVNMMVYSNVAATFTLNNITAGSAVGNCSTNGSTTTSCHPGPQNLSQGTVLDITLNNTFSCTVNFTTAFSCQ
jgi:hypothetical protein